MKAVVLQVSEETLARRHQTGVDRYDEMWEGVLHMAPAPAYEHQRMVSAIDRFLGPLCERYARGMLAPGINVFSDASASQDYRIPDLTFVAAGRQDIIAPDGIRGGGPDAVIEVRSPEDETYDKLPFFARLGVREVIVVHCDTKETEIYHLAGREYVAVSRDHQGWLRSEVLNARFARTSSSRLVIEALADDASMKVEI
jgi:Uma2 family endonuclease